MVLAVSHSKTSLTAKPAGELHLKGSKGQQGRRTSHIVRQSHGQVGYVSSYPVAFLACPPLLGLCSAHLHSQIDTQERQNLPRLLPYTTLPLKTRGKSGEWKGHVGRAGLRGQMIDR